MHSSSLDQVNGKTQDQISPSNGDTQSKSRTKKSSRKSKRKSVVLSSLKQENGVKQENSLLQREPSVREATPNKESSRQTPKSVENEMCPSLNGSELNIHSLFTIDVEMHLTQPIIADKTTTEREYRLPPLYTLGHEDTNSLLEKSSNVSNVSQPDPEDQKELKEFFTMPKQSRLKKQSILVGFQNVEQVTSGLTAAAPEASIYDGTEFVLEHAVGEHTAENEEEEDMIDTEVASRSQEIAGRCSWLAIKELSSQRRPTNKYRVARSLRASAVPEECGQTHGPTVLELLEMLSWNLRYNILNWQSCL